MNDWYNCVTTLTVSNTIQSIYFLSIFKYWCATGPNCHSCLVDYYWWAKQLFTRLTSLSKILSSFAKIPSHSCSHLFSKDERISFTIVVSLWFFYGQILHRRLLLLWTVLCFLHLLHSTFIPVAYLLLSYLQDVWFSVFWKVEDRLCYSYSFRFLNIFICFPLFFCGSRDIFKSL